MAAFIPGLSPPEVRTPIFDTFFAMYSNQYLTIFKNRPLLARIL
jgi:hypothetical protein